LVHAVFLKKGLSNIDIWGGMRLCFVEQRVGAYLTLRGQEMKSNLRQKTICILLAMFIITIGMPVSARGVQFVSPSYSLRVALGLDFSSASFAVSEGNYELIDYATQRIISTNPGTGTWVVAPKGAANLQLSYNGAAVEGLVNTHLVMRQKNREELNVFSFKNKRYRGDLLIQNINGKIQIINIVDVEKYLYGVVGAEMGIGAPDEAYKVQAVVSRTYALFYMENPQLNYDVSNTTAYQVYGGYDSELTSGARVKQAVDATKGQTIYYDNKIIQAFFHSNSGGYTESCENVWTSNMPYLRAVAVPQDAYAAQVPQNGDWPAVSFAWQKSYTRQELSAALGKWNAEHPSEAIKVGEIQDLVASRQAVDPVTKVYLPQETQSGRVTQLDFVGTSGVKSFFKDHIRSVLGLRSTLFSVCFDSTIKLLTAFGSEDTFNQTKELVAVNVDGYVSKLNGNNGNYYIQGADGVTTMPKFFNSLKIEGKGYGHGLGMSQWGAWGMAVSGMNYTTIIEHFYNQDKNDGRLKIISYQTAMNM